MKLRIEIPGLPPRELSPNARVHWAVKAKAAREYGQTVFYAAVDARNRSYYETQYEMCLWKNLDHAKVRVWFYVPPKRRRDIDNLVASFKSGLDALVRCGILVDDSIGHAEVSYAATQPFDGKTPSTSVEVEAI